MKIILVSHNANLNMGGEAIKAFQYFEFLLRTGFDAYLLTHARSRYSLEGSFPSSRLIFVEDSPFQSSLFKIPILRNLVTDYFHLAAAKRIKTFDPTGVIVHYLCPVSPVRVRFPPRGYDVVMGPFTGAIHYPDAFRQRMPYFRRLNEMVHDFAQVVIGRIFGDKKKAREVLVSGYERTHRSLIKAGCDPEKLRDVVDSGVSLELSALPRIRHEGVSGRFVCSGRMVDHKGTDLALRALALTNPSITLTICGDGPERPKLEAIVDDLKLADRVVFTGWLEHDELMRTIRKHRGYVFPSLAEANGIVMQEAMMMGLPVIALRWGGPAHLADDNSACYVDVESQDTVISGLATAMSCLADDGEKADNIAANAHEIAKTKYTWDSVAASWAQSYRREA